MSNSTNKKSITIARKRLSTKGVSIDVKLSCTPENWLPIERLIPSITDIPFQVEVEFSAKNSNLFTSRKVSVDIILSHVHDDSKLPQFVINDTLLQVNKDYVIPNKVSQMVKKMHHIKDTFSYSLSIPVCDDISVEDSEIQELNVEVLHTAKEFRRAKILYHPSDDAYIEAIDQLRDAKEKRELGIKYKLIEKHMLHIRPQVVVQVT